MTVVIYDPDWKIETAGWLDGGPNGPLVDNIARAERIGPLLKLTLN